MNKDELKKEIEQTESLKEKIKLEGRLIALLKEKIREEKNPSEKNLLRLELTNELEKHKKTIEENKTSSNKKIPISEALALKIKEIATTINIFAEKKDIISKLKTAGISTTISTIFALGIGTALTSVLSGALTLPVLASIIPTAAYIGLSNLIRIPFKKTSWEEYLKDLDTKDEEITKMKEFNENNIKNNVELLNYVKQSKEAKSVEELAKAIEGIISTYKEIEKKTDIKSCKYVLNAEITSQMNRLKKCYEQEVKDYIRDKKSMTNKEFIQLEKKSLNLDRELLERKSYFSETGKELGKEITLNTAAMLGTKLCLSTIFPSFAFHSLSDVAMPFIISVLNSATNIDTIKKKIKIKESKYCGKYIEANANLKEILEKIMSKSKAIKTV